MKSSQDTPSTPAEWEKIYLDSKDSRSIHSGKGYWWALGQGIVNTVENKIKSAGKYPTAMLNSDGSLSFFLSKCTNTDCNGECPTCSLNNSDPRFLKVFEQKSVIDQLDYYRKKQGFQTVGDKPFFETTYYPETELIEYKFNVSADNLDSLLKLNPAYSGYSYQHGLLRLYKQFSTEPGYIFAFPVAVISEDELIVRGQGCQLVEMPTVQLLHYIPGYEGPDRPFHWIPKEVEEQLYVRRGSIDSIFTQILLDQKMLLDKSLFSIEGSEMIPLFAPDRGQGLVRVVDMHEKAMDFYQLYGNCNKEELENCKSLEISTALFFEYIKKHLQECLVSAREGLSKTLQDKTSFMKPEYYEKHIGGLTNAISLIEEMIKTEKERLAKQPTSSFQHSFFRAAELGKEKQSDSMAMQTLERKRKEREETDKRLASMPKSRFASSSKKTSKEPEKEDKEKEDKEKEDKDSKKGFKK